jgi:hypothetical protein
VNPMVRSWSPQEGAEPRSHHPCIPTSPVCGAHLPSNAPRQALPPRRSWSLGPGERAIHSVLDLITFNTKITHLGDTRPPLGVRLFA